MTFFDKFTVMFVHWASSAEAVLLYDPTEPPSFFSARWNTYTNPDLAFAVGRSCDPKPERLIVDRFTRSHNRPSIIKVPSLVQPIAGKPVKRWNFRKANWELFTAETERRTPGLPNPQGDAADDTYTAYCNMLICAAKKSIPCEFNKHYIPGWDDSCNHLLREHQQATTKEDIDTTATALLHKLDEVRRAKWTEVVESVDFTHSSRKAWQTIYKLIGRSTTHSRCPITTKLMLMLRNFLITDASQMQTETSHAGRRVRSPHFLEQPPPMPTRRRLCDSLMKV